MAVITKVSPLAPKAFPDLPVIKGVRFATAAAGVKYQGRTDVMLAVADAGSSIAGSFHKIRNAGGASFGLSGKNREIQRMRVWPFW